jgi:predicted transcriptional regulator
VPCVNADGTLTDSAQAMLRLLEKPSTPDEVARQLERPLFSVRASLRELVGADLVRVEGGQFVVTDRGRSRL